jgi:hypothetical protein
VLAWWPPKLSKGLAYRAAINRSPAAVHYSLDYSMMTELIVDGVAVAVHIVRCIAQLLGVVAYLPLTEEFLSTTASHSGGIVIASHKVSRLLDFIGIGSAGYHLMFEFSVLTAPKRAVFPLPRM